MATSIAIENFIRPSDLGLSVPSGSESGTQSKPRVATPSEIEMLGDGLALIKRWEGLELEAYPDPATNGPPITIGYGCTRYNDGSPIKLGDRITKAQADAMLIDQAKRDFLPSLQKIPYWPEMSPRQKGALLSYAWNMGAGFVGDTANFATINRALSSKEWTAVPEAFMLYVKGGGRVMLGLKRRRHSEACLWAGKPPEEAFNAGMALMA